MRIHKDQIDHITASVLKGLKEKGLIILKADEERVLERMRQAVVDDMRAEDALDREVEGILNSHMNEMDTGGVDYRKMFRMLKNKLAKERGIIL